MQQTRPEGEVILMNKPLGWTSFQLVKKVKWMTKAKRVGHAGTLDPLATGLLVICTEKKTKTIADIQGAEKEYTGTFFIGATTPSFDKETPVDLEFDTTHITKELVHEAFNSFTGRIQQVPPLHSAVKLNGQRAYKIARRGDTAELKAREIEIKTFELTTFNLPEVGFRVVCSKGTYIRSLARDIGRHLNSGAYLSSLCRTRIGEFSLNDSFTVDDLMKKYPSPTPPKTAE